MVDDLVLSGLCPSCLMRLGLDGSLSPSSDGESAASPVTISPPERSSHEGASISETLYHGTRAGFGPYDLDEEAVAPNSSDFSHGRLRLLDEIARGGMGTIFRAHDSRIGRDIAVKVLRPEYRDRSALRRRFIEEGQIAGQLQHAGIIPIYDLGRFDDGVPFIAMKLVQGCTFAELLAQRIDPARSLDIFLRVCQAVAYAHARGVIHRDLKPSNIMVADFGEVRVIDWGLAKLLRPEPDPGSGHRSAWGGTDAVVTSRSRSNAEVSGIGSIIGTPAYMSPEQAMGDVDAVDERSDVFGLGSILCELLTGHPAYAGASEDEVYAKARRGATVEASSRLDASGTSPELVSLAKECLIPSPGGRPRNAAAVAERLEAHLGSITARLRDAEFARAAADAHAEESRPRESSERTRRRVTLGFAATVLAMIALTAHNALPGNPPPDRAVAGLSATPTPPTVVRRDRRRSDWRSRTLHVGPARRVPKRGVLIMHDRHAD